MGDRFHLAQVGWAEVKLAAVLCLLASCATTAPLAPLPPRVGRVDVDTLVPPAPPRPPVPPGVERYPDRPIRPGDCGPGAPRGVLVSPAAYADIEMDEDDRDRLARENAALRQRIAATDAAGRDFEDAAEAQLRARDAEVARLNRWAP